MKNKVVWFQPPMYPVNHYFFNSLSIYIDLVVYQIGDHPNFHIENIIFSDRHYELRVLNDFTYHNRKNYSLNFLKYLKKDNPDIVVSVAFWVPSFYLSLAKCFLKFKLVITTDATNFTETNLGTFRKYFRRFISKRTDHFIGASQLTKFYLSQFKEEEYISISRQTVHTAKWMEESINSSSKEVLRENLGFPQNKKIILGVGRFEKRKNWEHVFRNLEYLSEEYYFILVGEGGLKNTYEEMINNKDLASKVSLLPWIDNSQMISLYLAADFFVFPTLSDHFGFVVPEALSCGLPVICSSNAGASEFIIDGFNGYVIHPDEDFQDLIYKISQNYEFFTENAKKMAAENTLEKRAEQHMSIIEKILSQ
ncbi:glycosyltransferase family 4 protein [Gramella jeungdoensis]|uniref:Glycosyltransferase family 4 protein n=1 Tax=Gramella jeungdoensis TaxID=708091 RepID=A0ABT0Z1S6_9FLAO|nr:glycosyltransferase family 4 protein [Gramella jeungdoensis]MCM8568754.1 glycosyltransferase family 4 protein [Gramella jeungdoensis]